MKKILVAIVIIILLAPVLYVASKKYPNLFAGNSMAAAVKTLPEVKVLSPNVGGTFAEGSNLLITWVASSTTSVDIRLWNSQTSTAENIATNLPNTGSFTWKVKATKGFNVEYAIGVRGNNRLGISYDASDRNFKISSSSPSKVTVSAPAVMALSRNYDLGNIDGAKNVLMGQVALKSEPGNSTLTSLSIYANSVSQASTYYLYDGSTLLSSKAGVGTIKFDNLSFNIPANQIKNLIIKADYPSTIANPGVPVSVRIYVNGITYKNSTGAEITSNLNDIVIAREQYLIKGGLANFDLASTPTASATVLASGKTNVVTVQYKLRAAAKGGTMKRPTSSDIEVVLSGPDNTVKSPNTSVTVNPNNDIADGSTAELTITAVFPASAFRVSGVYRPGINLINWTVGRNTIEQSWGMEDFRGLPPVTVTK